MNPSAGVGRAGGPLELALQDRGRGRPVVLVHGWPVASATWDRMAVGLLAAGWRVVTYDRRGFGASRLPADGYDADSLADDLQHLLVGLDLQGCTLVGHGTGCVDVVRYLGNFGAERVERAVLVSAPLPDLQSGAADPAAIDTRTLRQALLRDPPVSLAPLLAQASGSAADAATLEMLRASVASTSTDALALALDTWCIDCRDDLPRIAVPTLVLHGSMDHLLPPHLTCLPLQREIVGARLHLIPGGPHGLPWSHAPALNAALVDFCT